MKVQAPVTEGQRLLPIRLWRRACRIAGIEENLTWSEISNAKLRKLAEVLTASRAVVMGKAVNADEFVTSGNSHSAEN